MCEQVEAGGAADVEDRCAGVVDGPDEARRLETLERLADRVPVDIEGDGELTLGRQRVTGGEPPGEHGVAQLGEHLVGLARSPRSLTTTRMTPAPRLIKRLDQFCHAGL